jgi:hypothetical protein
MHHLESPMLRLPAKLNSVPKDRERQAWFDEHWEASVEEVAASSAVAASSRCEARGPTFLIAAGFFVLPANWLLTAHGPRRSPVGAGNL